MAHKSKVQLSHQDAVHLFHAVLVERNKLDAWSDHAQLSSAATIKSCGQPFQTPNVKFRAAKITLSTHAWTLGLKEVDASYSMIIFAADVFHSLRNLKVVEERSASTIHSFLSATGLMMVAGASASQPCKDSPALSVSHNLERLIAANA